MALHLIFTTLILLCTSPPDAGALLKQVDAAATRALDMTAVLDVAVESRGSTALHRRMKIRQKGSNKRLIQFLAPARLRGTGILVADERTHLYLPAYKRIRRVAGKEGSSSFMGMGFSINDLARVRFSKEYTATLMSQTPTETALKLTPKDGSAHKHAWLEIKLRKADHLVSEIRALDQAGQQIRTIKMSDFKVVGSYTVAHQVEINEHKRGKKTVAKLKEIVFDSGLVDSYFSERQLKRAP